VFCLGEGAVLAQVEWILNATTSEMVQWAGAACEDRRLTRGQPPPHAFLDVGEGTGNGVQRDCLATSRRLATRRRTRGGPHIATRARLWPRGRGRAASRVYRIVQSRGLASGPSRLDNRHASSSARTRRRLAEDAREEAVKLAAESDRHHKMAEADCLVGCAVAGSMQGATLPGTDVAAPARQRRVSFAELQRRRQR
jgi:hypothetical protein